MSMPAQKPGRSKQDYGTPPEFLRAVRGLLGVEEFDCDLAASSENKACPLYFDEAHDSLSQSWKVGYGWNWLNPPFSKISPWVEKAERESRYGRVSTAVLVPASVGSNWWRDFVHNKARVLLLNGRITFVGETMPYPKDCVLLLYGSKHFANYDVWSWSKEHK